MADPRADLMKREVNAEMIPNPLPPHSRIFSRLSPAVLDTIVCHAAALGDAKTSTRTLLACARTCRAMLRPSQTYLFKAVVLEHACEQTLAFSRAIDSKPALGLLVSNLTIHFESAKSIYPLPPHVIGRLSNLQQAIFAGHVSKLQALTVILDYAVPLQLKPFGTQLMTLEVDAAHSFSKTLEYREISALENLETLTLRYAKDDISIVTQVLSHIRSSKLRWLAIDHRVQDQTREATIRQLGALDPKLQDVSARPIFWDLQWVEWIVSCTVLPAAAEMERLRHAVMPFVQVLADRRILSVRVREYQKAA
ncbi:hypothetical protein C8T65DRAFT_745091 [Cerioporus squamosus]|nr:hypothetical protein C8T65DRAFT_745091 [Cerioporus squamosus]